MSVVLETFALSHLAFSLQEVTQRDLAVLLLGVWNTILQGLFAFSHCCTVIFIFVLPLLRVQQLKQRILCFEDETYFIVHSYKTMCNVEERLPVITFTFHVGKVLRLLFLPPGVLIVFYSYTLTYCHYTNLFVIAIVVGTSGYGRP